MRVPHDIDPADSHVRDQLAVDLAALRKERGLTCEQVGRRLRITSDAVGGLERRRTWTARTVQAWARALDHRLLLELDGIDLPDGVDIIALHYEVAMEDAIDPIEQDHYALRLVHHNLVIARRCAPITDVDMGHRIGVSDNAVRHFESRPDGVSINALQRYARALGGQLRPVLDKTSRPAENRGTIMA